LGKHLQEIIISCHQDGEKHKREDVIRRIEVEYCNHSSGQYSGDFNVLVKNNKLKRLGEGFYQKTQEHDIITPVAGFISALISNIDKFIKQVDIMTLTEENIKELKRINSVKGDLAKLHDDLFKK